MTDKIISINDFKNEKNPSYLDNRNGIFYFVRKVPVDVRHGFGGVIQVWQSLKTCDAEEAKKRLAIEIEKFDATVRETREKRANKPLIFTAKNSSKKTSKYLLEAHISQILLRYEYLHLSVDEEERKAMSREERAEYLELINEGLQQRYDEAAGEDYSGIEDVVEVVLQGEKLIAPPQSKVREHLAQQLMQQDIRLLEIQRDRLTGRIYPSPRALPVAPRDLTTMSDVHGAWMKKQTVVRTIDTYASYVDEFAACVGPLPVSAIDAQCATDYRDYLVTQKYSKVTIKNRIGGLGTLMNYGKKIGLCNYEINPFECVIYDDILDKPASKDRRSYEYQELNKIFSSKLYTSKYRPTGQTVEASYWAPLLGLFAGARIEEIAQIRVSDICSVKETLHNTFDCVLDVSPA